MQQVLYPCQEFIFILAGVNSEIGENCECSKFFIPCQGFTLILAGVNSDNSEIGENGECSFRSPCGNMHSTQMTQMKAQDLKTTLMGFILR